MGKMKKKVSIAENIKVKRATKNKMKNEKGGSNVGKYTSVPKKEFAGPSGDAPMGSFPINSLQRAKAALAYAHNAPDPEGIRKDVYEKYPLLKKSNIQRDKNEKKVKQK